MQTAVPLELVGGRENVESLPDPKNGILRFFAEERAVFARLETRDRTIDTVRVQTDAYRPLE